MLRACDSANRLIELNLYINISDNTAPDFATDVQTEFTLSINDTKTYKLPTLDSDSIDTPVVYLNSMENQDFPAFVGYNNDTRTITFRPNSNLSYEGNTYYFSIVLK